MGKTLVIAEKPSVGRDIARVLGCKQKGDGFLCSEKYTVSWAVGHLVALAEPEDYDKAYKRWSMEALPIIPSEFKLKPIKKVKQQLDILKGLMNSKDISEIICATDSGREGELIFRYIYAYCRCKKPFKRLWISSMTDAAIKEGFSRLADGSAYDNLAESAKSRSEADWLVGINASRAFTLKNGALLSLGRVQTPTLALIVARHKEIEDFKPENYWEVSALFEPEYAGKWFDPKTNATRIDDEEKADALVLKTSGKSGFVKSLSSEEKRQLPPLLYDLTELQRDCNRKFAYPASKTLDIAQSLYEKRKLITYPRTDSRYLSEDMAPRITFILNKFVRTAYEPYAAYLLSLQKLPAAKRVIDGSKVSDHHAIIPAENDIKLKLDALSKDELNVYDLIARRFFCVFYPPYVYNSAKLITEAEGELFITKGREIVSLGWKELYRHEKKDKDRDRDEEDAALPALKQGDPVFLKEAEKEKKTTSPPSPHTEATLLTAMENAGKNIEDEALRERMKDSGLGTPSTRAAIIERLISVGYVLRKGKTLEPTEKGIKLIGVVPGELKSAETTGRWERGLSNISKGKLEPEKFSESIERYVRYLIAEAEKSEGKTLFPAEEKKPRRGGGYKPARTSAKKPASFGECDLCGGEIFENTKAFYCSNWKKGCKFTIWKSETGKYRVEDGKLYII